MSSVFTVEDQYLSKCSLINNKKSMKQIISLRCSSSVVNQLVVTSVLLFTSLLTKNILKKDKLLRRFNITSTILSEVFILLLLLVCVSFTIIGQP